MRKTKDGMNESRLKCCHQLVKYFDTKVIVAKSVQCAVRSINSR